MVSYVCAIYEMEANGMGINCAGYKNQRFRAAIECEDG